MTRLKQLTLVVLSIAMVVFVGSSVVVANENPCDTVPEVCIQPLFIFPADDEDA